MGCLDSSTAGPGWDLPGKRGDAQMVAAVARRLGSRSSRVRTGRSRGPRSRAVPPANARALHGHRHAFGKYAMVFTFRDGLIVHAKFYARPFGSTRSRGAVGVGDVAGERRIVRRVRTPSTAATWSDARRTLTPRSSGTWLQLQFGGGATVHRGHQGVRQGIRELEEAFSEIEAEQRDAGPWRAGRRHRSPPGARQRGGVKTESARLDRGVQGWQDDSGPRVLDPKKALEAVGLSE